MTSVAITECPRDAMQSWPNFIPTDKKIIYLKQLLASGFSRLDALSFVNPKAISQFSDAELLADKLGNEEITTPLIAIVGNLKGAERSRPFPHITHLGFPYSISSTFLQKNIHSTTDEALRRLVDIQEMASVYHKKVLIYLSMAFGNPYNDAWSVSLMVDAVGKLSDLGFNEINLSDTIGIATGDVLTASFQELGMAFPEIQFGAHLHVRPSNLHENLQAAWDGGCRNFDSAILGYGGCPVTADRQTGNLPTEKLLEFISTQREHVGIFQAEFNSSVNLAQHVFS